MKKVYGQEKMIVSLLEEAKRDGQEIPYHILGYAYSKLNQEDKAFECFQKAVETENSDANYYLGEAYYYGKGCEKNEKQAIECLKKAVGQDDLRAVKLLKKVYLEDNIVKKDSQKITQLSIQAIQLGDYEDIGDVAYRFFTDKDEKQALKYAKIGVEKNDHLSKYVLALLYKDGNVVSRDFNQTRTLLEELTAVKYKKAKEEWPRIKKEIGEILYDEGKNSNDLKKLKEAMRYGNRQAMDLVAEIEREKSDKKLEEIQLKKKKLYEEGKATKNVDMLLEARRLGVKEAQVVLDELKDDLFNDAIKKGSERRLKQAADLNQVDACLWMAYLGAFDSPKFPHLNTKDLSNKELINRLHYYEKYIILRISQISRETVLSPTKIETELSKKIFYRANKISKGDYNYPEKIKMYEAIVPHGIITAMYNLGLAYEHIGEIDKAIEMMDEVISSDVDDMSLIEDAKKIKKRLLRKKDESR